MSKVSFDFDSTIDRPSVQRYAKQLVEDGVEVWIVTSRLSDYDAPSPYWNKDLYKVAEEVGITKDHIFFTSMIDKYVFLKDKGFAWHLDDDWRELRLINSLTRTVGISVEGVGNWIGKCNRILKQQK